MTAEEIIELQIRRGMDVRAEPRTIAHAIVLSLRRYSYFIVKEEGE